MASDKELRVLADKIGDFFENDLPVLKKALERINKKIDRFFGGEDLPTTTERDMPAYEGDIEPSKPDPMPDDMPVGPGTTTDDIEAISEDHQVAPEPIDVFKEEENEGKADD